MRRSTWSRFEEWNFESIFNNRQFFSKVRLVFFLENRGNSNSCKNEWNNHFRLSESTMLSKIETFPLQRALETRCIILSYFEVRWQNGGICFCRLSLWFNVWWKWWKKKRKLYSEFQERKFQIFKVVVNFVKTKMFKFLQFSRREYPHFPTRHLGGKKTHETK